MLRSLKTDSDWRGFVKDNFSGIGAELGPLHCPFSTNARTKLLFVDIATQEELRKWHENDANITKETIPEIDFIGKASCLDMFDDSSLDFVCNSHLIEHLANPAAAIEEWLRVVKPKGQLYMVAPDKRFTFDKPREMTTLAHLQNDFYSGITKIEYDHNADFLKCVYQEENPKVVDKSFKNQHPIHVHVWDFERFKEFIHWLEVDLGSFKVQGMQLIGINIIVLLEKNGDEVPPPNG